MSWLYILYVISSFQVIWTNVQTTKISVSNDIVNIGDPATLVCTITLPDETPPLVNVKFTWTPDNGHEDEEQQDGNTFTSNYQIDSVSPSNAVQYNCSATTTSSVTVSGIGTVYTADMIQSPPNTNVVLDTSPYNVFTTQCTLTYYPDDAPITPTVSFSLTSTNSGDSDTEDGLMDTSNTLVSTRSVTIAKAKPDSEVTYQYTCNAMVNVSGIGSITVQSNTSTVTVRGPSNPVSAVLLEPTNISDTMATIRWIIPRVSYTPETYVVHYGLEQDNLNLMSEPVAGRINGDSFLTDKDLKYLVILQDLTNYFQYWYRVNSTNTAGSNVSEIGTFTAAEAAPEPPQDFTLTAVSSTVLRLTWDEPAVPNGVILYYNYSCSDTNSSAHIERISSTDPKTLTADITNLQPFIEYTCKLTASTSAGTSGTVTDTAVTRQAAPSGPPAQFTVSSSNANPHQLTLSWMPPELESRNGIITMYYYNCSNDTYSTDEGSTTDTTATVGYLAVFTNYTCTVRAATSEGRGPLAVFDNARTGEAAPSAVRNLSFNSINETSFNASWDIPEYPNGIITRYNITVVDYANPSSRVHETDTIALSSIVSGSFSAGNPYYVNVTAITGGGEGPVASILIFTEEGRPAQVKGVMVERINDTAARVSWTPLTLIEAAGFLNNLQYRVTLTPVTEIRKRQLSTPITQSFSSDVSSGVVTGLFKFTSYRVAVAGEVSGKIGQTSEPIEVPTVPTSSASFPGDVVFIIIFGVVVVLIVTILIVTGAVWMIKTRFNRNTVTRTPDEVHLQKLLKRTTDQSNISDNNSDTSNLSNPYNHDDPDIPASFIDSELPNEAQLTRHTTAVTSLKPDDQLERVLPIVGTRDSTLPSDERATSNSVNGSLAQVNQPASVDSGTSVPIRYESIPFTDEGLFYHSHDYGITIIIPPGAVQGPAVLQFGATQLLQGFKSELGPKCYPVSPFVWIHTEPVLTKPAELYIPHCVDTTTDDDTEIQLLTRNHEEENFKTNDRIAISVSVNLTRLVSTHFCFLCLITRIIPKKRYLLVCAWKEINPDTIHWDICVLYSWQCAYAFEKRHQGYKIKQQPISSFEELMVNVNFPTNSGWQWSYRRDSSVDFKAESIKEKDVDLYNVLDMKPGDTVSEWDRKTLDYYEDKGIYPKCLKLSFNRVAGHSQRTSKSCQAEISVLFSNKREAQRPSLILFDSKGDFIDEAATNSSAMGLDRADVYLVTDGVQGSNSHVALEHSGVSQAICNTVYNDHEKKKDRLVVDFMAFLQPRILSDYFRFGHYLGIPIEVLQVIEESVGHIPERCVKRILLYWRKTSEDVSSKAIANALEASGYPLLAAIANNQFDSTAALFCSLCDKPHGERRSVTESLCHVLNNNLVSFEKRPDIADLDNLVVARIPARWREFGVQLGIEMSEMEAIKMNNLGNCKLCFIELLDLWRRRGSVDYTWAKVIKVLHSPSFKEYLLAEEVYKFCLQKN